MNKHQLTIQLEEPANLEPDAPQGFPFFGGANQLEGHIYFYEQINQASALRLINQLHKLDEQYQQKKAIATGDYDPIIYLHLNSFGGEAFASFAIADRIQELNSSVHCLIEGVAASGATIVALACDRTMMTANSVMLIHQQSSWFVGTYEQWKDESKLQAILIERLIAFYKAHSNLDEDAIREMLKRDYWMDAQEAHKNDFIDFIYRNVRRQRD